jgi:hypothetical protein
LPPTVVQDSRDKRIDAVQDQANRLDLPALCD